jgi:hypothetical protein
MRNGPTGRYYGGGPYNRNNYYNWISMLIF